MAKLLRDTARRSVDAYFEALPPQAVVEVTLGRAPCATDLAVKVEISTPPKELRTTAGVPAALHGGGVPSDGPDAKPARKRKTHGTKVH